MDNEEEYMELCRLLAKYKFNMIKEEAKHNCIPITDYYEEKIKKIDEFIVDIPIIIKGDER